ncbi:Hypothetical predicted protein [Lecanosticta acicola]|uniref:Uncharacterized protein n=1 Tax=Lecanosticta acicola TaxID=111012 RepID=A0AAI9ECH1_9PEZI|nr:Hypothetical predicted protein [Lecanosticta acicola]
MAENDDTGHNNHPETSASTPNSTIAANSGTKAPKDRSCPFCGQAFTSSSLGRHLDLYIKPKNPKPADGIHNVDEIRKIRGNITRRQPRTSKATSVDRERNSGGDSNSTPVNREEYRSSTTAHSQMAEDSPMVSPVNPKDINEPAHSALNSANWQATGVINNLPPRAPSRNKNGQSNDEIPSARGQGQRVQQRRQDTSGHKSPHPDYENEGMWRLQQDAELGRAAEMALREVLGSLEAAQKRTEPKVLFDEFDFYSLSFPGLCLAILPPPSTLFSPTPFPSAESWTIGPPGLRQYEAMVRYVNTRFNSKKKTEQIADSVAFKHHSHLSGAWEHWQNMTENDRASAWNLEVLRSFTRAQEQKQQLRIELEQSQQHTRHLEMEFDRLSRCQLPRDFLAHAVNTVPIPAGVMREVKSSAYKTEAAEANFDVDVLLSKWRAKIKATSRPRAPRPAAGGKPNVPMYTQSQAQPMSDDIVMNGSVWGIGGPLRRETEPHNEGTAGEIVEIAYETPPNPGNVTSVDDYDAAENADVDAEGEAEDASAYAEQRALTRRLPGGADPGWLNANGKRPLGSSYAAGGGRSCTRMYRARQEEDAG